MTDEETGSRTSGGGTETGPGTGSDSDGGTDSPANGPDCGTDPGANGDTGPKGCGSGNGSVEGCRRRILQLLRKGDNLHRPHAAQRGDAILQNSQDLTQPGPLGSRACDLGHYNQLTACQVHPRHLQGLSPISEYASGSVHERLGVTGRRAYILRFLRAACQFLNHILPASMADAAVERSRGRYQPHAGPRANSQNTERGQDLYRTVPPASHPDSSRGLAFTLGEHRLEER